MIKAGTKVLEKLRIEYHVTDRCNLNCKACSHFSNLKSTNAEIPKTFEKIKHDFQKIWQITAEGDPKHVEKITLLGGEPLLFKKLIPTIDYVKYLFPYDYDEGPLQIVTNGILLPKMKPEFFECLRRNKIRVCMSIYPTTYTGKKIDHKSLFAILDKEKIDWYWYSAGPEREIEKFEDNQDGHAFSTKWLHTHYNENYKEYAQDCWWRLSCTHLVDNKVYLCPLIAYWKYFDAEFKGQHNFVITEEDSIDLNKINTFEELQVERAKIPQFCGYCRGHEAIEDKWGITERSISEYVYDGAIGD
jgi:MoaA/NifB/PqqE/SkfB family radical SAM enzyme